MTAETIIRRLFIIFLAYLAAAAFAGALVGTCFFIESPPDPGRFAEGLVQYVFLGAYFAAVFCALPALAIVIVAELVPWASKTPCVLGGAATGMILPSALFGIRFVGAELAVVLLGLVGGAGAGLIYWSIAGRHAGAFKRRKA